MSRSAPAYIDEPLPLECATCRRQWPTECECNHPTECRSCSRPLAQPQCSAGYCCTDCLHHHPLVPAPTSPEQAVQ